MKKINVGFLGLGTVGQGVWEQLISKASVWENKLDVQIDPKLAAVRSLDKKRDIELTTAQLTLDKKAIVTHPDIDLVIELMGGIEEAKEMTLLAFKNGKSVVTANKALVCEHGEELLEAANRAGVLYLYEASVAGGIPIIKVVQEALVGNLIHSIQGILNGTSNYILTRMENEGLSYEEALGGARELGYVEQDESLDLDGIDAAHKLIILTYLCFHKWFPISDIKVEGIRDVALRDIRAAARQKHKIKLIATLRQKDVDEGVHCSVRPSLVPLSNNLASVDDAFNGICIQSDIVGTSFLIGRGAGRHPTSSAVLSDIVDYCRNQGGRKIPESDTEQKLAPSSSIAQPYYMRIEVEDTKGVLSEITQILSSNDISISTIEQEMNSDQDTASIMLTTHECLDGNIDKVKSAISEKSFLKEKVVVFPILPA